MTSALLGIFLMVERTANRGWAVTARLTMLILALGSAAALAGGGRLF